MLRKQQGFVSIDVEQPVLAGPVSGHHLSYVHTIHLATKHLQKGQQKISKAMDKFRTSAMSILVSSQQLKRHLVAQVRRPTPWFQRFSTETQSPPRLGALLPWPGIADFGRHPAPKASRLSGETGQRKQII